MQRVLFHSTIFGPIHSRRLGTSLGINLSPDDGKTCTFDCLYCEAGFNAQGPGTSGLPSRGDTARMLEETLLKMKSEGKQLDVITFSGNGEPTIHPDFPGIIDDTVRLRDKYFPEVKVSVLSNATMLHKPDVANALRLVDNNILKLDSAIDSTVRTIDRPQGNTYSVDKAIEGMRQFDGKCIVQTMILRGEHDGQTIDNTTPDELEALAAAYRRINPAGIMLYSIDRKTPAEHLVKVERDELEKIAGYFRDLGFSVSVSA